MQAVHSKEKQSSSASKEKQSAIEFDLQRETKTCQHFQSKWPAENLRGRPPKTPLLRHR